MPETPHFHISAQAIAAVLAFTAEPNHPKEAMRGVYLEPVADGAIAVATDGKTLAIWFDLAAKVEAPMVLNIEDSSRRRIKGAARYGLIQSDGWIKSVDNKLTVFSGLGRMLYSQPGDPIIHAEFPNFRKVIPTRADLRVGTVSNFNAQLINRVKPREMDDDYVTVRLWSDDKRREDGQPATPIIVEYQQYPELLVAVMPCRTDFGEGLAPWNKRFDRIIAPVSAEVPA